MSFKEFTMLKTFLSAACTGILCFVALAALPLTKKVFQEIRNNFSSCVETKKTPAFALGAALLGMGMTLSGSCPGMVFIQVGSGLSNAFFTLGGCFTGALLYGLLKPTFKSFVLKPSAQKKSYWLDKMIGVSYTTAGLFFAAMLATVVLVAETYVPWTTERGMTQTGVGILQEKSWSPVIGGLLMGSLQIVIGVTFKDSLGGSSSYCTILSQLGLSNFNSYFFRFLKGIGNWWQVAYWIGATVGAALSAYLSGSWGQELGVNPIMGFLGGMLMLFGSRLSSGCTSGHGLSGMGLLSLSSFVAIPFIFGGGIGLALLNSKM